jgi:hypothetical protein
MEVRTTFYTFDPLSSFLDTISYRPSLLGHMQILHNLSNAKYLRTLQRRSLQWQLMFVIRRIGGASIFKGSLKLLVMEPQRCCRGFFWSKEIQSLIESQRADFEIFFHLVLFTIFIASKSLMSSETWSGTEDSKGSQSIL